MRKLIVSLAAAGAALAIASPAAAQYYPQPQAYPQAQPYGYGGQQYGYGHNGYGYGAQNLAMRVDMLQRRIDELRRAHVLRGDSAERLRKEARDLQRRVRRSSGFGYAQFAQGDLQMRLARLEQRVNQLASMGGYGGHGRHNGYGNNGYSNGYGQQGYGDRDRDHDRGDDRYDDHDD
jgi:hypothetical protein